MSAQAPDTFFCGGEQYYVVRRSGGTHFDPAQFEITTAMLHTGCYRGYLCTYEIVDGRLVLAALEIQAKGADGYPVFNGTPPQVEEAYDPSFIPPAYYHDVNLPMPFTGSLLLDADPDYSFRFSIYETPGWTWRKMLALELMDGLVQTVKDCSEEMAKIRAKNPNLSFRRGVNA